VSASLNGEKEIATMTNDDQSEFYRELRNMEVNPNEFPEHFRPETSKQELFHSGLQISGLILTG
jgi:hypothetical protein